MIPLLLCKGTKTLKKHGKCTLWKQKYWKDAQECSNIAQKASSESVYPEEVLKEVLEAMSKVKGNAKRIERKCKAALDTVMK